MASSPLEKKSVLLLRQKFEGGGRNGDDNKSKELSRRNTAEKEVEGSLQPMQCRPGGFGATKARVMAGGAQGLRRPSAPAGSGSEKFNVPSTNRNVVMPRKNDSPSTGPSKIQLSKVSKATTNKTGSKQVFVNTVKAKQGQGPSPCSHRHLLSRSKPKTFTGLQRTRSEGNLVERKLVVMKEKKVAKDPDARIGSPQPEEQKPLSIAERSRLFSAEEPSSSGRQCKQHTGKSGAPHGLTTCTYRWDSGDQGDDEGDVLDKLTQSVSPTYQLDAGPTKKGSVFGNQSGKEELPQASRKNDSRCARKSLVQGKDLPSPPSGFQKIIPKWFWRNRKRYKSGSRKLGKFQNPQISEPSSLGESELSKNWTQGLHPDEKLNVGPSGTTMNSAKPLPKIPECATASCCQIPEMVLEDPHQSQDRSTQGNLEYSKIAGKGSPMLPHQGKSSQITPHSGKSGLLQQQQRDQMPLTGAQGKDASRGPQIEAQSVPWSDELTKRIGKDFKPLPDVPFREVPILGAPVEEKPLIVTPQKECSKLRYQRVMKQLLGVPEEEAIVSGTMEAVNRSPQVPHHVRNEFTCTSLTQKTIKPLPKAPARDFTLVSVRSRPDESTKVPQPTAKVLTPVLFTQKEEAAPVCQPVQSCFSEVCDHKSDRNCSQVPEPADNSHLSQSNFSKLSKPLPEVPQTLEGSILTSAMHKNEKLLSASQKTEGHCSPVPDPSKRNNSQFSNPQTLKLLQDLSQSTDGVEATGIQTATKPLPVTRQKRRPIVTFVDGNFSKALPVLEEEPPAPAEIPKPVPRKRKQGVAASGYSLGPAPTVSPEEKSLQESQDFVKRSTAVADSICYLTKPLSLDHPDGETELTTKEQGTAESKDVPEIEQPKPSETSEGETITGNRTSQAMKEIIGNSDNDNSDSETGDTDGDSTIEGRRVIPLHQNKLLQEEFMSTKAGLRRTSSLEIIPVISVAFTNARGLFHRAQQMKSCESLDTAKPPIAQKPQLYKKPSPNDSPGSVSNKPGTAPKIGSPPRTIPKPDKYSPKKVPMDNIYDEVYREQSDPASSAKKIQQLLGPDFHSGDQTCPVAAKSKQTWKGKETNDTNARKFSTPVRQIEDKEGPYAVTPLPDADKTATKKTKNPAEHKPRKISDGNGNSVVLRNSGGMSSGDSGIVGLHSDILNVKRGISRRDRRISRRNLITKMKSIDSDFTECSDDDEPIGADSDFDSDTSTEEPSVFMNDPSVFIDESHKKAFEVLTTERTYVETLYLINQIFLAQIQAENQKQHWFPPTVLNEIFSNIMSIYQLHSAVLLPELEKRLKEWETNPCLGEALKKVAPFLKLYSDYVSNFDHAMKQLNLWTSKVPKFAAALAEMQKHPLCGNLALQHHMLTPVQRIPRYELLLKEYLRKLPADSADRSDADKALIIIAGAAKHSNDMMKSLDQFEKLLKINESIDGENIIDPTRHLLKEGKITKVGAKNKETQDRYIFLFNDILLCCEKKRLLASASYKVKLKLEVDGMKVLDSTNCRFIIESKTKSIEFQTNNEEDREAWMKELLSAICEMVRKKESFKTNDAVADRPNGVYYGDKFIPGRCAPRWIKDDETSMCMRCGTDFKITKRRHHCRSCGAVVCHKCCAYEAPLEYDDNKMNKVCFKCNFTIKGDGEELERLTRRSLIIEIDEEKSFGSCLYLHHKGVWTRFWVVVTEQDLFALKAPKDVRPVITLPIKLYSVRDLTDSDAERDHVFRLSDGRIGYTFSAESMELKRRWIAVLTHGIQGMSRKSVTL